MPQFDSLTEIILYAQDIEELTSFYVDVFDLEPEAGTPGDGFVKFDTGGCKLCLHAGGDGDIGRSAPKIIFEVDDMGAARSYLQAQNVDIGSVRSDVPGKLICDGRDPEGHKFSLESDTRG